MDGPLLLEVRMSLDFVRICPTVIDRATRRGYVTDAQRRLVTCLAGSRLRCTGQGGNQE